MNTKDLIIQELEETSEPLLTEVLDFVRFLKFKHIQEIRENQEDLDDIKGILLWRKEYKPQEAVKINLGWRVSWPKDQNISGL